MQFLLSAGILAGPGAKTLGATTLINAPMATLSRRVMELTQGEGVDVAIEAVGISAAFDICQGSLTTRLVDIVAMPMLIKAFIPANSSPASW